MATAVEPQLGMDEKVLESNALESALETREKKKVAKRAVNKDFRDADNVVKGLIGEFELADGEVARVGRFRIEKRTVAGGQRSFETSDSTRLLIQADKLDLDVKTD